MKKDKEVTEVIFRKEKDNSITAVFPYLSYRNGHRVTYYSHIGQHGEGNMFALIETTNPAEPEEYTDLKTELESIGYNLKVIKRACWRKMYKL